jgi:hypothetical protein
MKRDAPAPEILEPEEIWKRLLSGDPEKIRSAWTALDPGEKRIVRAHLRDMAGGSGWQPGQREAAQAALDCIEAGT